jgi:hypothetical protein
VSFKETEKISGEVNKMRIFIFVIIVCLCSFSVFAECNEQQVTQFFSLELQKQDKNINDKLDERLNRFESTLTTQAEDFKSQVQNQFIKASIYFSVVLLGVTIFVQGLIGFFRTRAERRYLEMIYKDIHQRIGETENPVPVPPKPQKEEKNPKKEDKIPQKESRVKASVNLSEYEFGV